MNLAEWATIICLPLAVMSDFSQLSSTPACKNVEVVERVKVVSNIQHFEDLPKPIQEEIISDAFGGALFLLIVIGLIAYFIKSLFSNRRW